jgi:hypothetical protein
MISRNESFAKLLYSSFRSQMTFRLLRPESRERLIILDTGLRRYDIIAGLYSYVKLPNNKDGMAQAKTQKRLINPVFL